MLRFVTSIKRKYKERLINREKQWPYCHGEKLVRLDLVKGERGQSVKDYSVNSPQQKQVERPIIKRTPLAYADLFAVKGGRKAVRRVLVEGDAGIGKTMLCTLISEDWANEMLFQQFELLLLLPLRERKVEEASSVLDLLKLFHSSHSLCTSAADYLEEIEGEKVLIIADGWDELSLTQRHKESFIYNLLFGKTLPFISVLLTSRHFASASLHELPIIDRFAEVRGFSKKNIKEFIISEFTGNKERADSLLEQLERNPLIESVCSIPLSCAIICHLWRTLKDALPVTMTELYTKIISNIVLRNVKKAFPENADILSLSSFNELPYDLQSSWQSLCKFSFQMIQMDQIVFTKEELVSFVPQYAALDEKILCFGLLQSTQSILDTGLGVSFSFLHLTFQEYLAAFYLTQQPFDVQAQLCYKFAMSNQFDMIWRFFSGITSKTSSLRDKGIINKLFTILDIKYNPWTLCHCLFEADCRNVNHIAKNFNWMCSFHPPLTAHDCSALVHIINHLQDGILHVIFKDCDLRDKQVIALGQALSNKQGKLQIESLDLSGNRISDDGIAAIFNDKSFTAFQVLQSLKLGANKIGPTGVDCILTLLQSTGSSLTVLSLAHNPLKLSGQQALLNAICGNLFTNLKALSLRGSLNDNADTNAILLTSLAESLSDYCPQLEKLDISENNLGIPGARALNTILAQLTQCKFKDFYHLIVTNVMFCCNALIALANCLEEAEFTRRAIHIDLSDNPIGLDGVAAVKRIISCNQVCILQLARCQLTESTCFEHLITSSFHNVTPSLAIEELNLDENNFSDDGIFILANLMHFCPALEELSCSNCKISSSDLSRLISVLNSSIMFSSLHVWRLDGNMIDDGGASTLIEHLQSLFPSMVFLFLHDNLVTVQMEMNLSKMIEQVIYHVGTMHCSYW